MAGVAFKQLSKNQDPNQVDDTPKPGEVFLYRFYEKDRRNDLKSEKQAMIPIKN